LKLFAEIKESGENGKGPRELGKKCGADVILIGMLLLEL